MNNVFLHLLNMSITAGWIVLAVILLRFFLRKAPKWISCLLWGLVALRLVLPFSIESVLSLIPSKETIPPEIVHSSAPTIHSGIELFNNTINPVISQTLAPDPVKETNPVQTILSVASIVWVSGIAIMLIYTIVSFLRVRMKVRASIRTDKNIFICDDIDTPFIFGLIKPRIYLPSTLSETDAQYVVAHEKAHLKRKDHLWKPFGFLLLSIYWFNPLLWVGYILLCRDIELACDEKVVKDFETASKKDYSTALLNCSIPRKLISACPLAFGEVGVKARIKNVLSYKKPALWIICIALIACIAASVCLLTNPVSGSNNDSTAEPEPENILPSDTYCSVYTCKDSRETALPPQLMLFPEGKRFELCISGLSSYIANGTFRTEGDIMTLEGEFGDKYTFRVIDSDNLEFMADKSTELPKYKYSANDAPRYPFENGAIFEREKAEGDTSSLVVNNEDLVTIYDTTAYDIDKDGVKEKIYITNENLTSGIFTFTVTVYEDNREEYKNTFQSEWLDLSFTENEGKLRISGITQDNSYKLFYVSLIADKIVLTESGGERLPYWRTENIYIIN